VGDRVAAIVPAAGRGVRMGAGVPKQFLQLGGIPLFIHSLHVLQQSSAVEEIILVLPESDREYCIQEILPSYSLPKLSQVVRGGARRQDSVRNGLRAVSSGIDLILVHDAVRPFLTLSMIDMCIEKAKAHGAAIVAVPMRDTVKKVQEDGFIESTVDRSVLWLAQTPQVFRVDLLEKAHRLAEKDERDATDDASLIERLGESVMIVKGSNDNIKITRPEDLIVGEALVAHRLKTDPNC
jgi:2-C-methyl-D-erythritol 4-phosphate cytidylyltransferase